MLEKVNPTTAMFRAQSTAAESAIRPRWVPVAESSAIVICIGLWLQLAQRAAAATMATVDAIVCVLTILLGFLMADAASGFFHWFCDTFFEENTPVIGARLIAPFREHHRDPLAMTQHGFLELNGNNCLALAPVLAAGWWLGPEEPRSGVALFGYTLLLSFSMAITATNQFHRWAHDPAAPRIALLLQRYGLVLHPDHHARHHTPPHRSAYCVTSGWINRLADRFGIFVQAERLLVWLGFPRSVDKS